jgi:hypothetical protein
MSLEVDVTPPVRLALVSVLNVNDVGRGPFSGIDVPYKCQPFSMAASNFISTVLPSSTDDIFQVIGS